MTPQFIPQALKDIPQWVCWRYEDRDGKRTKVPHQALRGARASSTDPATWAKFTQALDRFTREVDEDYPRLDGIGLVLTEDLGIVGVDLDHVSEWLEDANRIIRDLDSYTEVTPSGDGYRVFLYASIPFGGRKRKGYIEAYSSGRFLTVTGQSLFGGEVEERHAAFTQFHKDRLAADPKVSVPKPTQSLSLDDDALVARIRASAQGAKSEYSPIVRHSPAWV